VDVHPYEGGCWAAASPSMAPSFALLTVARLFRHSLTGALLAVLLLVGTPVRADGAQTALDACLGDRRSLIVSNRMPYTPVQVQGAYGFFVVDLGSDGSAISPGTFLGGGRPAPAAGTADRYERVDFFGPWGPLRLSVQDFAGIRGLLPQAGMIGTDLLRDHVVTIDYGRSLLHRAERDRFCSDEVLRRAGFQAASTGGYYGADAAALTCPAAARTRGCPNIPTIPIRIGGVAAVAQIDTGYDDGVHPPSLNINTAFLWRLQAAGVPLRPLPAATLSLSTCVPGVRERVVAYGLAPPATVDFVDLTGQPARSEPGVTLFVKDTPPAARRCGGIGTWSEPAGQLGASFFASQDALVVDPFTQRVWWRPRP
jgi:hypothetical protein